MYDYVSLGTTPHGEDGVQLCDDRLYANAMKWEARMFIAYLEHLHPNVPSGAIYRVQSNSHDFGTYYDAIIQFSEDNNFAMNYAYEVEGDIPEKWDFGYMAATYPYSYVNYYVEHKKLIELFPEEDRLITRIAIYTPERKTDIFVPMEFEHDEQVRLFVLLKKTDEVISYLKEQTDKIYTVNERRVK